MDGSACGGTEGAAAEHYGTIVINRLRWLMGRVVDGVDVRGL